MTARLDYEAQAAFDELYLVARDWLNVMDFDMYECTCEEGDPCPRCRCVDARRAAEPYVSDSVKQKTRRQ